MNTRPSSGRGATVESNRLKTYLLGVAQKLRNRGLKAQTETPTGTPAATVLHTALKSQADLIVMTTHGRSGLQRLWLGSVAANIVHQSTVPGFIDKSQ